RGVRVSRRRPPADRRTRRRGGRGAARRRACRTGPRRRCRCAGHDAGRADRRPGAPRTPRRGGPPPAGRALLRRPSGRGARVALRAAGRRVKISILAFDLSDNATGRADLLARLLAPLGEAEVVGPRFGESIWRPARNGTVAYRDVVVTDVP